jgi:hypothetical protein
MIDMKDPRSFETDPGTRSDLPMSVSYMAEAYLLWIETVTIFHVRVIYGDPPRDQEDIMGHLTLLAPIGRHGATCAKNKPVGTRDLPRFRAAPAVI